MPNNPRDVSFTRADRSILAQWWWTIDRWNLTALIVLVFIGIFLNLAASPPIADRLGLESFHFFKRQMFLLPICLSCFFFLSFLKTHKTLQFSIILFSIALFFTLLTLAFGSEIKGAKRWVNIAGFTLQPSELLKPSFAVLAAWLFSKYHENKDLLSLKICIGLFLLTISLLVLQPDIGMTITLSVAWLCQFFIAGLSTVWIVAFGTLGIIGIILAYFFMPHVTARIDSFLDPEKGDQYQVQRSLESFSSGGVFGRGPGEGLVKERLPDAHTDFIFAVAGEEFGFILCMVIIGLFCFIVLRGVNRALQEKNIFILLAVSGLLMSFGFQAFVNIASSLHLIPTKGMTLPFISYGGSSFLSVSIAMGMVLGLTKKNIANYRYY